MTEPPLYIRVHPEDNVAIVVNGAGRPAGTVFSDGADIAGERAPRGHKVNLVDLPEGAALWPGDRHCRACGAAGKLDRGIAGAHACCAIAGAPAARHFGTAEAAAAGGLHIRQFSEFRRHRRHPPPAVPVGRAMGCVPTACHRSTAETIGLKWRIEGATRTR